MMADSRARSCLDHSCDVLIRPVDLNTPNGMKKGYNHSLCGETSDDADHVVALVFVAVVAAPEGWP